MRDLTAEIKTVKLQMSTKGTSNGRSMLGVNHIKPINLLQVILYQPVIYTSYSRYHHSDLMELQNCLHYQNSQYIKIIQGTEETNFQI